MSSKPLVPGLSVERYGGTTTKPEVHLDIRLFGLKLFGISANSLDEALLLLSEIHNLTAASKPFQVMGDVDVTGPK